MSSKPKKKIYERVRGDSGQHRRIMAMALIFGMLAFVPVSIRLYQLMITDYDYYAELALRNQTRSTRVTADRGILYDRNMNVLACNTSVETVYLDPHELKQSKADLEDLSRVLAEILELEESWVRKQASDTTKRYKQIAAGVEEETAGKIRSYINEKNISGIHLEPNSKRSYPYGTLASQVVGFTNSSNDGCEGIEAAYDSYLAGGYGTVITTKGNNEMDMPYSYEHYAANKDACDVIMTLDVTVQTCLEKQMQAAIDRYAVQNGAFGMVMNVNTGEILAMATLGGYDPNRYSEVLDQKAQESLNVLRESYLQNPKDTEAYRNGLKAYQEALQQARLKQWRNRCISDGYEPGSTFKVLTMAAALDTGAIDLNTAFYCKGSEHITGRSQLLHCWRSAGHGSQKTPQALQNSCNLAFAHIALKLGGERFYEYVKNFGILEKTGIDLAGESKGVFFDKALVTNTEKFGTASLTSGSFGQTFKLTPIQLVRAISAVVNGGNLVEPYVVSEVLDQNGNTVLSQEPTVVRRVIKEETSVTMRELMRSVVTEGTAKNANVFGFSVGGKTGTSEKIDVLDENGQPTLDKIVSFVGVAPMDDPQYIVLVALDTPSRSTGLYISGGVMAAPTVGAVLGDILPYLGVSHHYAEEDVAGKTVVLQDLTGMTRKDVQKTLKSQNLTAVFLGEGETVTGQIPGPGRSLPGNSQVLVYMGEETEERMVEVPDFTGMHRQQACDAAGLLGLYVLPKGNNGVADYITAISQSVPKGMKVPVGTTITVEFTDKRTSP
ncbi:MAG: PASTA domain-containing protein [Oscillospiraceae bacterium]|nr:PASTA domain-containing protein [Oscillospiraceae bacterium]